MNAAWRTRITLTAPRMIVLYCCSVWSQGDHHGYLSRFAHKNKYLKGNSNLYIQQETAPGDGTHTDRRYCLPGLHGMPVVHEHIDTGSFDCYCSRTIVRYVCSNWSQGGHHLTCAVMGSVACTAAGVAKRPAARTPAAVQRDVFIVAVRFALSSAGRFR